MAAFKRYHHLNVYFSGPTRDLESSSDVLKRQMSTTDREMVEKLESELKNSNLHLDRNGKCAKEEELSLYYYKNRRKKRARARAKLIRSWLNSKWIGSIMSSRIPGYK